MNDRIEKSLYEILEGDHHAAEDRCRAAALLVESLGMQPPAEEEHDHAEPERQAYGVTMTAYQLMELRRYVRAVVSLELGMHNEDGVNEAQRRMNEAFNIQENES